MPNVENPSCLRNHRTAWDPGGQVPPRALPVFSSTDTLHAHRLQDRAFGSILLSSIVSLGGACNDFCNFGWAVMAAGRFAGAGHVDRANRVCLTCNSGAIGDEKHIICECTALSLFKQQHAGLFTPRTSTVRSFFAQQYHLGVLNYVIDCLNFMNIRNYCHDWHK